MVDFYKNWNGKLDWGIIPTIRFYTVDKYIYYLDKIGYPLPINLKGKKHCIGYLWQVKKLLLKNIPSYFTFADSGLTPPDFYELMAKMYSKKPEWKGDNTLMIILLFVKDFSEVKAK